MTAVGVLARWRVGKPQQLSLSAAGLHHASLNLPQHFPGRPIRKGGQALRFACQLGAMPGLVLV